MAYRLRLLVSSPFLVASLASVAAAASLVGPFEKDEYPQAVIDRPLTLPCGMVEGELGFQFTSRPVASPDRFSVGGIVDDWDADVTLRVGVTDRVQLEVGTAFSLDHTIHQDPGLQGARTVDLRPSLASWQRVVPVRLSLLAVDTETVDTALRVTVPFVAHAERRVGFPRTGTFRVSNGEGRVIPSVALDAPTRWRLTDWLWLRAGESLFSVATDGDFAAFSFVFGVGVQLHELFAVTLDSSIATVSFDGSGHSDSLTLADRGPIDLEATFAPCRFFDVVGDLAVFDVGSGFDAYALRMGVRVRL